jgi:hypothetical protein
MIGVKPMNIVLLESLGIPDSLLNEYAKPLTDAGHCFTSYPKDTDPEVQIQRAKQADVIMIANMPLSGQVISACEHLKFIDVAFTGVDHVDLEAAKKKRNQGQQCSRILHRSRGRAFDLHDALSSSQCASGGSPVQGRENKGRPGRLRDYGKNSGHHRRRRDWYKDCGTLFCLWL